MEAKTDKPKKKQLTAYWGIEYNPEEILRLPQLREHIELHKVNPNHKLNTKFHTTLLYVGKKVDERENVFIPLEGRDICVTVTGFGISNNAIAVNVSDDSIMSNIPSFNDKHHITIALANGTPAKDSVKTLCGEGTMINFDVPITIVGKIKRYLL